MEEKKSGYILDRKTYKMLMKSTRENFENFIMNMYKRAYEEGAKSVKGVDIEEIIGSASDVRGIGAKRSADLEAKFNAVMEEKGMAISQATSEMETFTENFSKRVQKLLDEKSICQRELAVETGLTEVTIARYMSKKRMPIAPDIVKIAKFLGVSTGYLMEGDAEE